MLITTASTACRTDGVSTRTTRQSMGGVVHLSPPTAHPGAVVSTDPRFARSPQPAILLSCTASRRSVDRGRWRQPGAAVAPLRQLPTRLTAGLTCFR
jgi:hypothetical protein